MLKKKKICFLILIPLIFSACVDEGKEYTEKDYTIKLQIEEISVSKNSEFLEQLKNFQNKKTLNSMGINGNVSKIIRTNYWFKKTKTEQKKVFKKLKTDLFEFNSNKQLILHNSTADDGELFFTNTYIYDKEFNLTNYYESNDVRFVVRSIPTYSLDSIIIKESHFNKDEIDIGNSAFVYDENTQTITKNTIWTGGKTKNKEVSKIDIKGNVLIVKKYETIVDTEFPNSAETVEVYAYNENSLVTEEKQYNPWALVEDYKERLYATISNTYDDNNLLIESTHYKKDGAVNYVLKFEYKLDNNNNWIEKTISKDGVKESQFQREITYF